MLTFSLKITFAFKIHHKKHLLTPKTAAKKPKPTDVKANRLIGFTCEVENRLPGNPQCTLTSLWMTSRRTPTTKLDRLIAKGQLQLTCDPCGSHERCKFRQKYKLTSQEIIAWLISGCKENHFYSLPFGQAEASIQLAPKTFWLAELISQFFCYSNSSKNITCPSGKLKTEFTSPIAKSTSPRLSETTFFARWIYKDTDHQHLSQGQLIGRIWHCKFDTFNLLLSYTGGDLVVKI